MNNFDRRRFLQASSLAGAALLLSRSSSALSRSLLPAGGVPDDAPKTQFETSNGAQWTTHANELLFLAAVADRSARVSVQVIGETAQRRPLHLVTIGAPGPRAAAQAKAGPITLFICSQHGNEPAGRETGLTLLRDLAFTTDPVIIRQLEEQTILVIPSANPDGRAANTRANAKGTDINRDHLNLVSLEARAMRQVMKDYDPDLVLDLHEYGPGTPVLYDDEILYLWPRNLNVDAAVRDMSRTLCVEYIKKGVEAAGYTADEYGLDKVGNEFVVQQTAGDEDEGICRNAMGLRHSLGVLIESAVSANVTNTPMEAVDGPTLNRRRVASQRQVSVETLRFMRANGEAAKLVTESAVGRKIREGAERSAPVYFYGADNKAPTTEQIQDPPPSGYRVKAADLPKVATAFDLHGITTSAPAEDGSVIVPMAQAAEPLIPLLLDARARRESISAEPLN